VKVQPVVAERRRITHEEWRTTSRFRIFNATAASPRRRRHLREQTFWQTSMRYTLTNARPTPVTVFLTQDGLDHWYSDTRIISETIPSERVSADRVMWRVEVPANGTTILNAVFQTRH
jgi:hypothetical protein